MSDTTPEYSVWLTFDARSPAYERYRDRIAELAETVADAPVFEPHVTVVGGVDGTEATLVETTRTLASEFDPVEVTFGAVRCSTTRHQCVFRLVDPSLELFRLHGAAREASSLPATAYVPHLSLVYSDMGFQRRLELAASVDVASLPDRARAPTLTLVDTTGAVDEWESVASVRL